MSPFNCHPFFIFVTPQCFGKALKKKKKKRVNIDLHYGIELGEGRLVDFRV